MGCSHMYDSDGFCFECDKKKGSRMVVTFGGGTNSTALLVGLWENNITPDAIVFADTGGERPHTYKHIENMQNWLKSVGYPSIDVVKNEQPSKHGSLEAMCLKTNRLPAVAYGGFKTCSIQFKIEPVDKYIRSKFPDEWKAGRIIKCVGIDAGEERRAKESGSKNYTNIFPLLLWDWDRDDCIDAIDRAGLSQPGKSSCFFCPNMKQHEIREMAVKYPDLMDRAIKMEENAELSSIAGLGRNYAWKDLIATDEMFPDLYKEDSCYCYDGD